MGVMVILGIYRRIAEDGSAHCPQSNFSAANLESYIRPLITVFGRV
jgi:hypothetical protein